LGWHGGCVAQLLSGLVYRVPHNARAGGHTWDQRPTGEEVGSDKDRLAVFTHAMAIFTGELTGLLGTFGKEAGDRKQPS
jgi:hypothetical protein